MTRHLWYSQLPFIGKIHRYFSYYYLSFNLVLLLKSGMNIQEICSFLLTFEPHTLFFQLGEKLKNHLLTDKEVDKFIKQYPFIPMELIIFLNKGQTASELSEDLNCISDHGSLSRNFITIVLKFRRNILIKKKSEGFTLIEMAIVLFIISLLILIIIPNINHQRKNAVNINSNAMKTKLRTQEHPEIDSSSLTINKLVDDHYLSPTG